MQITTVSFGKTFNLGHFESQRIDLTATLDDDDDVIEATLRLKADVLRLAGDIAGSRDALGDAEARHMALVAVPLPQGDRATQTG